MKELFAFSYIDNPDCYHNQLPLNHYWQNMQCDRWISKAFANRQSLTLLSKQSLNVAPSNSKRLIRDDLAQSSKTQTLPRIARLYRESIVKKTFTTVMLLLAIVTSFSKGQEMGEWIVEDNTQPEVNAPAELEADTTTPVTESKTSIPENGISGIRMSMKTNGAAPEMIPYQPVQYSERFVSPKSIQFVTSDFRHRRLLFEQPMLERHGITPNENWQPVISGAHFFGSTFLFPFELAKLHHRHCDSSLGWGTPGSLPGPCGR